MASLVRNITFDTTGDPYDIARFWADVVGGRLHDDDQPGDPEAVVLIDGSSNLLFIRTGDAKAGKNRVHVDLQPQDRTRDEEVERLLELGATLVDDQRRADGTGWVVLADPEGNELCVERSAAERAVSGG